MNTVKIDYELEYSAENIGEFISSLSGTIGLTRKEKTNALQIILLNLVYFSFCPLVTPPTAEFGRGATKNSHLTPIYPI